jgi:pimeloyl-ACP methyl ester carboxylesterase
LAHAQIANSEFVKFAGEDHFMPITKRKEIDKAIDEFLAKHELQ